LSLSLNMISQTLHSQTMLLCLILQFFNFTNESKYRVFGTIPKSLTFSTYISITSRLIAHSVQSQNKTLSRSFLCYAYQSTKSWRNCTYKMLWFLENTLWSESCQVYWKPLSLFLKKRKTIAWWTKIGLYCDSSLVLLFSWNSEQIFVF
jgi:hypothetical protein